ncbi:MAG: hypothetical protein E7607_08565 [Ruminococcaceae bacterium]|nr:hypothetical protein [Oscillospiraceae bacterium]
MKKILCIILALVLSFLTIQLTVYAETEAECEILLDSNGATVTDFGEGSGLSAETLTLTDAFRWVYEQNDSERYTIRLLKDVTVSTQILPTSFDANNIKTVRIDGEDHTLTSTVAGGIFGGLGIYNLYVYDLNMVSSNGDSLEWMPKTTAGNVDISGLGSNAVFKTWFENCTLNAATGKSAGTLKVQAGAALTAPINAKFHVTIKDSVFNCNNAVSQFYVLRGPNLQLDIIGSVMNKTVASAGDGRFTTFLSTENGASVALNVKNSESNTARINISTNVAKPGGVLYDYSYKAGTHVLRFGAGAEIYFNNTQAQAQYIVSSSSYDHITVVDEGASFIISKNALVAGASLTLPSVVDGAGDAKAWLKDGTAFFGSSFSDSSTTDDVTFTSISTLADDPDCYIFDKNGDRVISLGSDTSAKSLTLNRAFSWVYSQDNSEDYTVKLLKNVNISSALAPSKTYDQSNIKTVRIDGNGHTLTATQKAGIFCQLGLYNLYVYDLNMVSSNGDSLDWTYSTARGGVPENFEHFTAWFENCTLIPASGAGAGTVKIHGKADSNSIYNVTFKDCRLTATNTVSQFYILGKPTLTLNIVGTELNSLGGATGDVRFGYMFASQDGSNVTINVSNSDNNTALLNESLGVSRESGLMADFHNTGSMVMNLEKGVKISFNTPYDVNQYITAADDVSRTTVNDNGAVFTLGKEALSAGADIYLNTGNQSWIKNSTTAFYGSTYSDSSATEDVILTRLGEFGMQDGASVRLTSPTGIRFTAEFAEELLNRDGITVGLLVATYNPNVPLTGENFTHEGLATMSLNYIDQEGAAGKFGEDNGATVLRVALTGIPENANTYQARFAARAYVRIGETYCYSDFSEDLNTRSVYEVARNLLETEEYRNNEILQGIIDTVENSLGE